MATTGWSETKDSVGCNATLLRLTRTRSSRITCVDILYHIALQLRPAKDYESTSLDYLDSILNKIPISQSIHISESFSLSILFRPAPDHIGSSSSSSSRCPLVFGSGIKP
jgi:hypothetical protein